MRLPRWRVTVPLVLLLALLLFSGAIRSPVAQPVTAAAPMTVDHANNGRDIDTLVVGDSFIAGNGADGGYYDIGTDDPHPLTNGPYAGSGCYRSYNNAAMQAYGLLGSNGFYINRACSGKLTTDILPEVENLIRDTAFAAQVDLVVYSAGGNDASFADIARHCILLSRVDGLSSLHTLPDGRKISAHCYRLLEYAKSLLDTIVASERTNLINLLSKFPNSHVVFDGYPMLTSTRKAKDAKDFPANTVNYTHEQLSVVLPQFATKQKAVADELNRKYRNRVAYNDVYTAFGGAKDNHGVNSSKPWMHSIVATGPLMESLHPNPAGHKELAKSIKATIDQAKWFSSFPVQAGKTNRSLNYVPGTSDGDYFRLADNQGNAYIAWKGDSPQLRTCNKPFTVKGWVGATGRASLSGYGPDTVKIECSSPRAGDLAFYDKAAYVGTNVGASGLMFKPISTGWLFNCLAGKSGVRRYPMTRAEHAKNANLPKATAEPGCVPREWRSRVLAAPSGHSYFVDQGGTRHHILSTETFGALTSRYGSALRNISQIDIDTIPVGADQPEELNAGPLKGTIIRRSDGVSWVVDNNAVRHHIPTAATDICARWIQDYKVGKSNLTGEQAASLPEGGAWGCDLNGSILAANEGASYLVEGNQIRWIQDPHSFGVYASGRRVIRGIGMAEIRTLTEGPWMPKR